MKYLGKSNPSLWLGDYQLVCQVGGADHDYIVIRNLPLFVVDLARAWLENLM
jgi:hypothetical protein